MIIIKDFKIRGKCEHCGEGYVGRIDKRHHVLCPNCSQITTKYTEWTEKKGGKREYEFNLMQIRNKYGNDFCKNKNFAQNKYFEWINIGCRNLKRNGSAWCQKCAEDHFNGIESVFEQPKEKKVKSLLDVDETTLFIDEEENE